MLTSPLLAQLEWIDHGFGTRLAPVSQEGMASLKQIHSTMCLVADGAHACGEGDALIANQAGIAVSVRTADCYPVLLADPVTRAVAAIHAGWRGTAASIVGETLRRMHQEFGTQTANVIAAIGPGIGGCCYEVGAEVARRFGRSAAGRIDLAAANRRQLREAGVPDEQIHVTGACTFCDAARFHSYRRDKDAAGRMISYISLRP
jgi:purine-nucleoside/S-methyl-5'-thioadenosine phosphorylase / adenosine deaminase